MNTKPLVSIICVTYKHEKFIKKALKGFVSQKTNFPFEAIIAEDYSPDNSRELIKKYADKYPNIIKPLYRPKNLGMMVNYTDALSKIQGKYVAICDGDDYWIDENKLQKQVNFLEENKDFSMCCHPIKQVYLDKSKPDIVVTPLEYASYEAKKNGYLTFDDFFPNVGISSSSVMYRWSLKKTPKWLLKCSGGDLFLHLYHSDKGKVGVLEDTMSVYQRHPGGIWWGHETIQHQLKYVKSYLFLLRNVNKYLNYRHNKVITTMIKAIKQNHINIIKDKSKIWKILRKIKHRVKIILSFLLEKENFSNKDKIQNIENKIKILEFAINDVLYTTSNNLQKKIDLLIIDDLFPQKKQYGFRNTEFLYYLNKTNKNIKILNNNSCPPNYLGKTFTDYYEDLIEFTKKYPNLKENILYLNENKRYEAKLIYVVFESLAYYNLEFFEKNKIPFIFTLYPGGMFAINDKESDLRKKQIFKSPMFKKVIVTQQYTKKYLLEKKLCPTNKIEYIPLGFSQIKKTEVKNKKYFKKNKDTFDICFVAFNYTKNGYYKGYDLLIETAKKISQKHENIKFHIVGNWNEKEIQFPNIKFYGIKTPDFFPNFYASMDIFISLSRTSENGAFDGFPLGVDASFCGVALFASDELKQNTLYKNNKDIVIVDLSVEYIINKIEYYYNNLDKLYEISKNGQKITQKYTNTKYQCESRIKIFNKIIE